VAKVTQAGEHHCHAMPVGGCYDFVVAHAAAGLDDGCGAGADHHVHSDAFFPFRDGVDVVVRAGAAAIIQPGGSVRDEEVIAAADEHGVAMVFTGYRHFRH